MAASNIAESLMEGPGLFDNLFSLVYPSPMLIPLAVADGEPKRLGIYQSGVRQCRVTEPLKHRILL